MNKIKNRKKLEYLSSSVYMWLLRHNCQLLDKYLPTNKGKYTLDICKNIALKYKNKNEWAINDRNSYQKAKRSNWLNKCCSHMKILNKNWKFEECIEIAKKYKTRSEWWKKETNSYNAARIYKWLNKCCEHMEINNSNTRVVNLDTNQIFESIVSAAESINSSSSSGIIQSIKKNYKAGGYRWAYCDENGNVIK